MNFVVRSPSDWERLGQRLLAMTPPLTVSIMEGAKRSNSQNDLQHAIYEDVAKQLGDRTAEDVKKQSKLCVGVPILRRDDEKFRAAYDDGVKDKYTYEQKVAMMGEPVNFPVTSRFTTKQSAEYTEALVRYWAEEAGVYIKLPGDM